MVFLRAIVRKMGIQNLESLDENLYSNTGGKTQILNYLFMMYTKYFVLLVNILPKVPGGTLKG